MDRLGVEFGVVLSSTLLFASPTIAELTDHLAQEHLPAVVAKFKKDLTLTAGDQVSETVAELTALLTQKRWLLAAPATMRKRSGFGGCRSGLG